VFEIDALAGRSACLVPLFPTLRAATEKDSVIPALALSVWPTGVDGL
jgi:hypothetical protein